MTTSIYLHDLVEKSAQVWPDSKALLFKDKTITYAGLADYINKVAFGINNAGLDRTERVAVYLPKQIETVVSYFSVSKASGVFVPVNPVLKPRQVVHILRDCNARILITNKARFELLVDLIPDCHDLQTVILVDSDDSEIKHSSIVNIISWNNISSSSGELKASSTIDTDMVSILYTSGSTGKPKGVVLSHRNMITGAYSVSEYLQNNQNDRLLAVLPFSFDYGFSQLSTAFCSGASVVLMDYLLPRDVIKAVSKYKVTGLAAVPPLWIQLAQLEWDKNAKNTLRYITNSGGSIPQHIIRVLQRKLSKTSIYLMYGLTEAFRSTYLPPDKIDSKPGSMGKAIPNAEIMVVREDGSICGPGEPGELVHRGSLVALGYWNDEERTAERFRPAPGSHPAIKVKETAVWSGDTVRMDEDGYFYFIGRQDDMIKTSGYRTSPSEIEEIVYGTGLVGHAAAIGVPHPVLGQAIVVVVTPREDTQSPDIDAIHSECKRNLPAYMVPAQILIRSEMPRNPNGKIDRKILLQEYKDLFKEPRNEK